MLYLVLILVITAFGLLIAALTTAHTVWAWLSVAISVVAAGLLVFDWLRGRRRVAATSAPRWAEESRANEPADDAELGSGDFELAVPDPIEPSGEVPPVEPVAEPVVVRTEPEVSEDGAEPGEEATDATDLLIVTDLGVEVRVVDEHPRYHLAACGWLVGKQTLPLPVSEARQLGFTPCVRCGPDAVLAARHRASRGATQ